LIDSSSIEDDDKVVEMGEAHNGDNNNGKNVLQIYFSFYVDFNNAFDMEQTSAGLRPPNL